MNVLENAQITPPMVFSSGVVFQTATDDPNPPRVSAPESLRVCGLKRQHERIFDGFGVTFRALYNIVPSRGRYIRSRLGQVSQKAKAGSVSRCVLSFLYTDLDIHITAKEAPSAECGNGKIEAREECDDGSANGNKRECSSMCKVTYCGDGMVQLFNGR